MTARPPKRTAGPPMPAVPAAVPPQAHPAAATPSLATGFPGRKRRGGHHCLCVYQYRDGAPVTRIQHHCPVHGASETWRVIALKKRLKRAAPA